MDELCSSILAKVHEQIDGTEHLIGRLPADCLDWAPPVQGTWPVGLVVGHLLDCLAGFCAVMIACEPERLRHFAKLRDLPVNHLCPPSEGIRRIAIYRTHIDEGFALLDHARLGERVPTVFVPEGETVLTLLLGNLEHLINHKHQLFTYLKLMGVNVTSQDLYRYRA